MRQGYNASVRLRSCSVGFQRNWNSKSQFVPVVVVRSSAYAARVSLPDGSVKLFAISALLPPF